MSNSAWPHRRQPTRLPCPWDSPGKNTGVGCRFLLQCMKVKSESEVTQSCPTLRDPMDCSLPSATIHGIFQARVLEWGAITFSNNCPRQPEMSCWPVINSPYVVEATTHPKRAWLSSLSSSFQSAVTESCWSFASNCSLEIQVLCHLTRCPLLPNWPLFIPPDPEVMSPWWRSLPYLTWVSRAQHTVPTALLECCNFQHTHVTQRRLWEHVIQLGRISVSKD